MSENAADSLNNSAASVKTDLHYLRSCMRTSTSTPTPPSTPPPPPPPARFSKSQSFVSHQLNDLDDNYIEHKSLMPSAEKRYKSSVYLPIAATVNDEIVTSATVTAIATAPASSSDIVAVAVGGATASATQAHTLEQKYRYHQCPHHFHSHQQQEKHEQQQYQHQHHQHHHQEEQKQRPRPPPLPPKPQIKHRNQCQLKQTEFFQLRNSIAQQLQHKQQNHHQYYRHHLCSSSLSNELFPTQQQYHPNQHHQHHLYNQYHHDDDDDIDDGCDEQQNQEPKSLSLITTTTTKATTSSLSSIEASTSASTSVSVSVPVKVSSALPERKTTLIPSSSSSASFSFAFDTNNGDTHNDAYDANKINSSSVNNRAQISWPFSNISNQSTPKSKKLRSSSSVAVELALSTPTTPTTPTHGSKWRKSWFHSCDDLDASVIIDRPNHNKNSSSEKKVIKSLKYLCACTGATLRNLSKRTKDLHAKNSQTFSEPAWRVWGDEMEKDAIFRVYLKKVRYHRPTPTASAEADGEISHLAWETVRVRSVRAATLERLVEALATNDVELESTFINVFLSTYRTFSTPKEVLNLLIKRYDTLHEKYLHELEKDEHLTNGVDESVCSLNNGDRDRDRSENNLSATDFDKHKKTLVSALHVWLDGFPEDWNEENLRIIKNFAAKRLPHSELHNKVHHRLERILRQQMERQHYVPLSGYDANAPHWLGNVSITNGMSNIRNCIGNGLGISLSGVGGGILSQHYNSDISEQLANLILAPQLRRPTHFLHAFRFPHVPVRHFAEQLTRIDSELFKRLIPHQCLGATWARRDKGCSETVVDTIKQFNAVLFRVISSILIEPRLKTQERALNIATWIDIAQELRLLKNFSSLKAIISGLQSNPIYRLTKTWAALSKEKVEIFNELERIYSEDNNASAQREVLMREGTAKFADTVGENDSHLQKIIQNQSTQTSHGTIPYLGMFLTDLTMTDTAVPDTIGEEGFINFDKKRREFETLAQIKLLQGAANTYNLREDAHFDRWFISMPVLNEREAYTLSCQLEPPQPAPRKSTASMNTLLTTTTTAGTTTTSSSSSSAINSLISGINGTNVNGHRKTDSIASTSSSGAGSHFYTDLLTSIDSRHSSRHSSLDRDTQLPNASLLSASSSVSNLSTESSNSGGQKLNTNHLRLTHSQSANGVRTSNSNRSSNDLQNGSPMINAQCVQKSISDFYIIRVTYETDNVELDGIVLYKSIMLGNNERTPQVIRNAMMKLGLEADPDKYTLAQILPDKELVMPKNANVFYAVNANYNLNFILRPKKNGDKDSSATS